MRKRTTVIGMLVILAGAVVAVYPWLTAARFEYDKRVLLAQWESSPAEAPRRESYISDDELEEWEENTQPVFDTAYALGRMEGVIQIKKINVRSPILYGTTQYNLNLAVCVVPGSPGMGGEGNYCIAGHNSRIYARHFNRLTELEPGDIVTLSNDTEEFVFAVTETMSVTPESTWVLADSPGKTELTLITCDYTSTPTGRFVVRCEPASSA